MKLTAKELRIGNLFIGYNKQVFEWGLFHFDLLNNGIEVDEIIQSEIPLTEEWLIKFGFEKDNEYKYFVKEIKTYKEFILDFSTQSNSWFLCDTDVDTDIKYVHQLQNLYFALTNKELTINK